MTTTALDLQREALAHEAARALDSYIRTGVLGFWQKGLDRLKALDMVVDGFQPSADAARRLLEHLELWGWL